MNDGVTDPKRPVFALKVVHSGDRDSHPAKHVGPISVSASKFQYLPSACRLSDNLQTFIARYDAAKVVHENGKDMMAGTDVDCSRVRASPFECLTRPAPVITVWIDLGFLRLGNYILLWK